MTPIEALVRLLADCAQHLGMEQHSYIVGGAPRDHLLCHEVKDVDVVVEPKEERDALTLGTEVARRLGLKCHADFYGVVHIGPVPAAQSKRDYFHQYLGVSLVGQKVEIVTSRKEKYDRSRRTGSQKPYEVAVGTLQEDLERRDFTINTLMWRLADLQNGFAEAPIIDLLGGRADLLQGRILRTPLDPLDTFDDDPSRMLRAVRFAVKYDLGIDFQVYQALIAKSAELRRIPHEAFDQLFFDKIITLSPDKVRAALLLMDNVGLLVHVREMIPEARMRRAIRERVTDIRLLLTLANWGFSVGVNFFGKQLSQLLDAADVLSDEELDLLFKRFQVPFDSMAYIGASGAQGPAIRRAIERGRDLVLLGMSPERVMEVLLEERP